MVMLTGIPDRLRTIISYDRILVMDQGAVAVCLLPPCRHIMSDAIVGV